MKILGPASTKKMCSWNKWQKTCDVETQERTTVVFPLANTPARLNSLEEPLQQLVPAAVGQTLTGVVGGHIHVGAFFFHSQVSWRYRFLSFFQLDKGETFQPHRLYRFHRHHLPYRQNHQHEHLHIHLLCRYHSHCFHSHHLWNDQHIDCLVNHNDGEID